MIPPQAKKVFSGVIFDVYQWPQKVYDGTVQTFEKLKRATNTEVIAITDEGNILILSQFQPDREQAFLSLSGGRVEEGEVVLDAAKRELLEETGYVSNEWSLLHEVQPFTKLDWTLSIFIARGCRRIQDPHLDAGEKIEVREVTFDEFIRLVDQNELSHIEQDLRVMCVRAVYDPTSYQQLKQTLFGG